MWTEILEILAGFFACYCIFFLYIWIRSRICKRMMLLDRHIVITGGSAGIGLELAKKSYSKGCSVTIIARDQGRIDKALVEIEKCKGIQAMDRISTFREPYKQTLNAYSVDLSTQLDCTELIAKIEENGGPIDVLINNAGFAYVAPFETSDLSEFRLMMDTNYFPGVYLSQAVVPSMKDRKSGRIVFVSSQASQAGIYGYTGYAATKCAINGFAQVLQSELKPFNIRVCISFPPDTDTPGFAKENEIKPELTKILSETGSVFKPQKIAEDILKGIDFGRFYIYHGFDGFFLAMLNSGMSPVHSLLEGVRQVALLSLFRFISFFYLLGFDRTIARKLMEKEKND
ncbi:3-ketodihydrosphingosine reductase isoform X1 [Oopsacas minuta]|uniref:3-dehydrosphinganine reductase n=1 Tax=Oopsacas minuta TaxID=111878 RepID=A0AAV7JEY1_9METZ|nr:3-ketodihydrosphingosine reductase isoform X1 [Oopsacas minuta]